MRFFIVDKLRVKCVGGDGMNEDKQLVFLEPSDIPRLLRGKSSRNWTELFDKIPKGKVLAMDNETYGSAPNIRAQVKTYNVEKKDKVLTVTQRTNTETEEVLVYVTRITENKE